MKITSVISVVGALALLAGCGGSQPPLSASPQRSSFQDSLGEANLGENVNDATNRQTFGFIDKSQSFTIPNGIERITIIAKGAGTPSARGGFVKARVAVHPGDVLTIFVGGTAHDEYGGFNGGGTGGDCAYPGCPLQGKGGAGASDVRLGGTGLKARILVAGGAGGRGGPGEYHGSPGGAGGGLSGEPGVDGVSLGSGAGLIGGGGGGGGGSQDRGGVAGAAGKVGKNYSDHGNRGRRGQLGIGGTGAGNRCYLCSMYGLLAGGSGGGGGGGYYGGGGGGSGSNSNDYTGTVRVGLASGGGGGGGSSFVETGAQNVTIESGKGNSGNGLVVILW